MIWNILVILVAGDHDGQDVDLVHPVVVRLVDRLGLVVVVFVVRTRAGVSDTLHFN